jgi:hypothetical protein
MTRFVVVQVSATEDRVPWLGSRAHLLAPPPQWPRFGSAGAHARKRIGGPKGRETAQTVVLSFLFLFFFSISNFKYSN